MLTRVVIRGYKCLQRRTKIELRPLTVLTGVNSSGKSSVIQAILLTAQTAQSRYRQSSAVLNGPLVQLGTFGEVVSSGANDMALSLTWTCRAGNDLIEPEPPELRPDVRPYSWSWYPGDSFETDEYDNFRRVDAVTLRYRLCHSAGHQGECNVEDPMIQKADIASLQYSYLHHSHSRCHRVRHIGGIIDLTSTGTTLSGVPRDVSPDYDPPYHHTPTAGTQVPQPGKNATGAWVPPESRAIDVVLNHFLPEFIVADYDRADAMARDLVNRIARRRTTKVARVLFPLYVQLHGTNYEFPQRFEDLVDRLVRDVAARYELTEADARQMQRYLSRKGLRRYYGYESYLTNFLGRLSDTLRDAIATAVDERKREFVEAATSDHHYREQFLLKVTGLDAVSVDLVRRLLTGRIKYLGPLRTEPQASYGGPAWDDPRDVGTHGEHSAAVLASYGATNVECIRPSRVTDAEFEEITSMSLLDATRMWLQHLGVADDLTASDLGAPGYDLVATAPGETRSRALAHLGTGVSQVLPVVVMALLAPRDSLLMFEQPELHLHPRVQARLADFFYAMTLLGKQCLVESHSEYLVDRIRYLCVAESSSRVSDNVGIYFSNRTENGTVFRRIDVNENGVMGDWPDGFFDESKVNSLNILYASLAKRKRRNGDQR